MDIFNLSGKVAVVTGGNGGIGLGIARGLARAGAGIAVIGRNAEKSATAVKELDGFGVRAIAVEADVSNGGSVNAMVDQVASELGRIDILVNNAGTNIRKLPQDLSEEEWHTVMDVNLTSAFLCSKACYPHMVKAGGGKILNNGSMATIFGAPWVPAYASSKGGMAQLTKSLATAWAKDNIQVNCFLPGWINTDLTRGAREQIEGLHKKVEARAPAGRWGEPEEFEGLAVFLASQATSYITGAIIPIDGGYSIAM